ncbi:MAG: DUF4230 domain-containing protein [Spirochaetaceae bacterium]|nr:DUF4230 domain-containing protein [Spirochaetaceae bacterium]
MAQDKLVQGKEPILPKKRGRIDNPEPPIMESEKQKENSKGKARASRKLRNPKSSKKKSFFHRFFKKLFLWLLLIAIILVALLFLWQKLSKVEIEKKYALVSQELQYCSELTTVKINYSDIVTLKKSAVMGIAKSYSIVKFSGVIRCGIENLGESRMYIDEDGKGITLRIPAAKVLGNDIQEISVFDEQQSIFVPITTQEVLEQVELAREETLKKTLDSGILAESEQQARALLTTILSNMGFLRIDIQN